MDGTISPRVGGETLLTARATLNADGTLTCNALSSADVYLGQADQVGAEYTGQACACMQSWNGTDYAMCAGHGVCVPPVFTYGDCSQDVADVAADPLASPLVQIPAAAQLPSQFVFSTRAPSPLGLGDLRSVVAIQQESWLLTDPTEFTIPTLLDSFTICTGAMEFPLNVTFTCSVSYQNPVRGWALQSVYSLSGNTTQQCDPAVTSPAAQYYCPVQQVCGSPPCVYQSVWSAIPGNNETLNTGSYQDVWYAPKQEGALTH